MRVTRIPDDKCDIGDRPCRVFCNEVEIQGWTVADDFRRVVETPGGVHHGAVRIELTQGVMLPVGGYYTIGGKTTFIEPPKEAQPAKPNHHIPPRKRKAGK